MSGKPIQLTPEQAAAIQTRDVSIALSAGAGCGKTFVLTERFLRLLAPGCGTDPLGRIVAITFTDRAAREMRDRIRAACHAALESCPESDVGHWQQILRGLDTARISTIHAFCAALLRSRAVEANLDPGFDVLDRASGNALLRRTVLQCMHELLTANEADCTLLVRHYGLERTEEFLRGLVRGLFQADPRRFEALAADELAAEWRRSWQTRFVPALIAELVASPSVRALVDVLQVNEPAHRVMQERRACLLDGLPRLAAAEDAAALLAQLREAAMVKAGGGKSAWASEDVYDEVKNGFDALRKTIDRVLRDLQVDESQVQAASQFAVAASRVSHRVGRQFAERKRRIGALDFDDLLLLSRNLLRDNNRVRAAMQAGIDFLMIDEFQDTDPVQADIVRLLAGDQLKSGRLFIVGDVKQSIYRFRRADPGVFTSLRGEIPSAGRMPLSTNFRSQPEILKFVNALFAPVIGEDYEPLRPHVAEQISPTPAIEFLFARPAAGETESESARQRRAREADWIARRLASLLGQEQPCLRERDRQSGRFTLRKARPRDIAILLRTLSNVDLYEAALQRYDLPYYLVGGRAFYAQQEIYDLVNLCRYLIDSDDSVSLAGVLRSPLCSLTDETLLALLDGAPSLHAALLSPGPGLDAEQRQRVEAAADMLAELRSNKDRLGLADLFNVLLDRTGYDATLLTEFLGRRKLANLQKLVDLARQFDRSGLETLNEFAEQLSRSVLDQTDEELAPTHAEASNVIRLMTIHQAKGLEFPVVVVADMDWARPGSQTAAHFHPELGPLLPLPSRFGETPKNLGQTMHKIAESKAEIEENVRLLYVATTRAADYLFLSAGLDSELKVSSEWLKLLAGRFNLQTGLPQPNPLPGTVSASAASPEDFPEIRVHTEPPEYPESTSGKPERLPLARYREEVGAAQAAPLPPTLSLIPTNPARRRRFIVSEIEEADAALRGPDSFKTAAQSASEKPGEELDATQLGTLVHAVLEQFDPSGPGDVSQLVDQALARLTDRLAKTSNKPLRQAAVERVKTFLASPVAKELANAKRCLREVDFVLRLPRREETEPETAIVGKIDCLLQSPDGGWKILDYKTGRIGDEPPASVRAQYEMQLTLYALAVRESLGKWPKSAELVFINESVRHVSLAPAETEIEAIIGRARAAVRSLRAGS